MAGRGPSRQELIRRRRRSGLVGRQGEQTAFREALKQPQEEATQFLFHIHGPAGVGKSTLVRQLESAARESKALTAYVDESVADAMEAMEAISSQFAQQGTEFKSFDRLLATYRQRRHEANAGAATAGPPAGESAEATQELGQQEPSPSSLFVSQLGLAGLGMIPGVGAFTGAVDPNQVAAGADRVKAMIGAKLRSHEDVQLVLSPLQSLTPEFLQGIAEAAGRRPWVVLFFDTYERIGPVLDVWLRDMLVSDRYGQLPANVLVVLAGQSRLDTRCWGDWLDLVTNLPLEVFTDAEARQLLAAKGITDEQIIKVVLDLSGRLPVLVSTLAEGRPVSVEDVGDPSGTAVERFLKWEGDPARRAAALACALPQELDEDVYRAAVDDEEARPLFAWLQSMPFVIDRGGHCRYHDVVRAAMLRLQRQQSPLRWQDQHTRLATAFRERRIELEESGAPPAGGWWEDERWRNNRLQETYHLLCADHRAALRHTLRELLDAHDHDITTLRRWTQTLAQAGRDADATPVRNWGLDLLEAQEQTNAGIATLTLLLMRGQLDTSGRALAYVLRGWEYCSVDKYESARSDFTMALELESTGRAFRGRGESYRLAGLYEEAVGDFTRAIEIDPENAWAIASRGQAKSAMGRLEEALSDLSRAIEIDSGKAWIFSIRGLTYQFLGRQDEALSDLSRAVEIAPGSADAIAARGVSYFMSGRHEEALADFTHASELNPNRADFIASLAMSNQVLGKTEEALADLTRAIELDPDSSWIIIGRGQTYIAMGKHEEAQADFARALSMDPGIAGMLVSRETPDQLTANLTSTVGTTSRSAGVAFGEGLSAQLSGRNEEALDNFTRAIELESEDSRPLIARGQAYCDLGRHEEAIADFTRAIEITPENVWPLIARSHAYRLSGDIEEALADCIRAIEIDPTNELFYVTLGVIYRIKGRYEEALDNLTHSIELDPSNTWAHYEKAVVLHALGHPSREQYAAHAIEILTSSSPGPASTDTATVGNLFLIHCVTSNWGEAQRYLNAFMTCSPSRGQIAELIAALNTLVPIINSREHHLAPFRRQLEDA